MALGRLWAGKVYGTNTGNLFVELNGEDAALQGTLRFNEAGIGVAAFNITGSFEDGRLTIAGEPLAEIAGVSFGALTANATLGSMGELEGQWKTEVGTAGTFFLFPHDRGQVSDLGENTPDQLHTARHEFGAIEIEHNQIISIAEDIQREFPRARVVVSVDAGTEQSRFLENFKTLTFHDNKAESMKVFAQELESGEISKLVSLEFGPNLNQVIVQGAREAWVLGQREKLKREVRRFERAYTTKFKRLGFGINHLLVVASVIFLPSLASIESRVIFVIGIVLLIWAVSSLHNRYLPFAAIYLSEKPKGLLARVAPAIASWVIAVTASSAATVLGAYLKGWLELPPPPS